MRLRGRTPILLATSVVVVTVGLVGCGGGAASKPAEQQTPEPIELSPDQKVRLAGSYYRAGRVQDALRVLKEAVEERPDDAHLHSVYGRYLFEAGRFAQAETELTSALALDEYLTDARNYLGVTYIELDRYNDAQRELQRALQDVGYASPESIHFNLAKLYIRQGRNEEALESLRRSVEINPTFYQAHYEMALLLDKMGQLDEAAREFDVAEPAYKSVGEYHYRRGFVHFRLGNREQARASLERCLAVAPGSNSAAEADDLLKLLR